MSRTRRVLPLFLLPGLATAAMTGGDSAPDESGAGAARLAVVIAAPQPPANAREAADHRATRPIVWKHHPDDAPPFGFIPTDLTVRPELLPNTWDVQTVPATAVPQADQPEPPAAVSRSGGSPALLRMERRAGVATHSAQSSSPRLEYAATVDGR